SLGGAAFAVPGTAYAAQTAHIAEDHTAVMGPAEDYQYGLTVTAFRQRSARSLWMTNRSWPTASNTGFRQQIPITDPRCPAGTKSPEIIISKLTRRYASTLPGFSEIHIQP